MNKIKKGRLAGFIFGFIAIMLFLTSSSYACWETPTCSCPTCPCPETPVCQLNIPADPVNMIVNVKEYKTCDELPALPLSGLFDATFSNVPDGYSIENGIYPGYCADLTGTILDNPLFGDIVYQVQFWSSLDPNLPVSLKEITFTDENSQVTNYTIPWDKINYVINTYPDESWLDLQPVIWALVHGCNPQTSQTLFDCAPLRPAPYYFPFGSIYANVPYGCPDSNPPIVDKDKVNMIVSDANTNGAGFKPTYGQKVAVVVQLTGCTPSGVCDQHMPFQIVFIPVTCPEETHPSLSISKTCSGSCSSTYKSIYNYWWIRNVKPSCYTGSECTYNFTATVTNNGDETIENITCKDDPDVPLTGVQSSLAPGESFTVTGTTKASSDTLTCTGKGAVSGISVSESGSAICTSTTSTSAKPSIDVKKYVSTDGWNWSDANFPPGIMVPLCSDNTFSWFHMMSSKKSKKKSKVNTECYSGCGSYGNCGKVYFKFVAKNTGDTTLTNISLTDSEHSLRSCTIPNTLSPNSSFKCVIGPISAEEGQQKDTATVSGYYDGTRYEDTDDAFYYGYRKSTCWW